MAEANRKQDRMAMMAELPVHEVLIKMSLPMMISFFIQAMYNIVDSMFVARISENALTAISDFVRGNAGRILSVAANSGKGILSQDENGARKSLD